MLDMPIPKMTDGGLVKSNIIKHDKFIVIPMEPLEGWFVHEYVLITYSKVKNELKLVGIDDVKESTFVDMIIYTDGGDPVTLVLDLKPLLPEGHDMPWTSGICTPGKEVSKRLGLGEKGCVWESIMKLPNTFPASELERLIKKVDKDGIVKNVEIKALEVIG